jgi:hypothetical protein
MPHHCNATIYPPGPSPGGVRGVRSNPPFAGNYTCWHVKILQKTKFEPPCYTLIIWTNPPFPKAGDGPAPIIHSHSGLKVEVVVAYNVQILLTFCHVGLSRLFELKTNTLQLPVTTSLPRSMQWGRRTLSNCLSPPVSLGPYSEELNTRTWSWKLTNTD